MCSSVLLHVYSFPAKLEPSVLPDHCDIFCLCYSCLLKYISPSHHFTCHLSTSSTLLSFPWHPSPKWKAVLNSHSLVIELRLGLSSCCLWLVCLPLCTGSALRARPCAGFIVTFCPGFLTEPLVTIGLTPHRPHRHILWKACKAPNYSVGGSENGFFHLITSSAFWSTDQGGCKIWFFFFFFLRFWLALVFYHGLPG